MLEVVVLVALAHTDDAGVAEGAKDADQTLPVCPVRPCKAAKNDFKSLHNVSS